MANRIERDKGLIDSALALQRGRGAVREYNDMLVEYHKVHDSLLRYCDAAFTEWQSTVEGDMGTMLDIPIMKRNSESFIGASAATEGTQVLKPLDPVPSETTHESAVSSNVRNHFHNAGLLEVNFDVKMLSIFEEVRFWSRSPYEVPYAATAIAAKEDVLRVHRENVALVAREYNDIILQLSEEEHRLFRERLARLDRRLHPGTSNLFWSSKSGTIDFFVKESRRVLEEHRSTVGQFKVHVAKIYERCCSIAETLLVKVESKRVYTLKEFEREQLHHRMATRKSLIEYNRDITNRLCEMYYYFEKDSEDIQNEWWNFVRKIEARLYGSLVSAIRMSIEELTVAINGDKQLVEPDKDRINPLISCQVILMEDPYDDSPDKREPSLQPSLEMIANSLQNILRTFIRDTRIIPKLEEHLRAKLDHIKRLKEDAAATAADDDEHSLADKIQDMTIHHTHQSFNDTMDSDMEEEFNYHDMLLNTPEDKAENDKNIIELITGVDMVQTDINNYLNEKTDKFKNLWITDNSLRRLSSQGAPAQMVQNSIDTYKEASKTIEAESSIAQLRYLQVDCSPLKVTLDMECNSWITKILDLAHSLARDELNKQLSHIKTYTTRLKDVPHNNLDALIKMFELIKSLQRQAHNNDAKFISIEEKYQLLEKHSFSVPPSEIEDKSNLMTEHEQFVSFLETQYKKLEQEQEKYRLRLKSEQEQLGKTIVDAESEFKSRGPFSAENNTIRQAKRQLRDFRKQLESMKMEENRLKSGLKVFQIEMGQFKEMGTIAKDLESLEKLWDLHEQWEKTTDRWRLTKFLELDVEEMRAGVSSINNEMNQALPREARNWEAWTNLKDRVNQFRKNIPLVENLKNPAIRQRHWKDLSETIGSSNIIDPANDTFNLDTILRLRFDSYIDDVQNISGAASQELSIENDLFKIRETWETLELDLIKYKEEYDIIRSTEDIFINLEDNTVTLGAMKISPYVASFSVDVNYWERTLSKLSDTIELLLTVQKQWQYLLNIFDVEDIQKQLQEETAIFKQVNTRWKNEMSEMARTKIVMRATLKDGLSTTLHDMNKKLEKIQKQLDDYLEVKRSQVCNVNLNFGEICTSNSLTLIFTSLYPRPNSTWRHYYQHRLFIVCKVLLSDTFFLST